MLLIVKIENLILNVPESHINEYFYSFSDDTEALEHTHAHFFDIILMHFHSLYT